MEQNIFESGLNETAKAYLMETTRWTKFLAIMGFILSAFMFITGFVYFFIVGKIAHYPEATTMGMLIYFLVLGAIYIYPSYTLIRFSSCIKRGINGNDMDAVTEGFRYQKNLYRFMGIFTILGIVLVLLLGIFAGIGGVL